MRTITGYPANGSVDGGNHSLEGGIKPLRHAISRRSFLGKSIVIGAGTIGAGFVGTSRGAPETRSLHNGDAALLRFTAALELLEADFWIQYNELAGLQDS